MMQEAVPLMHSFKKKEVERLFPRQPPRIIKIRGREGCFFFHLFRVKERVDPTDSQFK